MEQEFLIFEDKHASNFMKSIGVVGGIIGGLVLMLTGLILSAIAYFDQMNFHGAEIILLVASVGLLIVGAHSLDLIEKDKKGRRHTLCKNEASTIEKRQEDKPLKT